MVTVLWAIQNSLASVKPGGEKRGLWLVGAKDVCWPSCLFPFFSTWVVTFADGMVVTFV